MEKLTQRAVTQRVINTLDFKRVAAKMSNDETETFKYQVTVIDTINGRNIPSLFNRSESILERASLQNGISLEDYSAMSNEDKQKIGFDGIRIDDNLETVDVFGAETILRSEFEKMDAAHRTDTLNKGIKLIDKAPPADYSIEELQALSKAIKTA